MSIVSTSSGTQWGARASGPNWFGTATTSGIQWGPRGFGANWFGANAPLAGSVSVSTVVTGRMGGQFLTGTATAQATAAGFMISPLAQLIGSIGGRVSVTASLNTFPQVAQAPVGSRSIPELALLTSAAQTAQVTDIPALPADTPLALKRVLEPMREYVQTIAGRRGDDLDTAVTFRDLIQQGIATVDLSKTSRFGATPISLPVPPDLIDYSTPPAPTDLTSTNGIGIIFLSWNGAAFKSYAYTEIWRATTDDIAQASLVATSVATRYADSLGVSGTRYYWVRFVSKYGITGPFNTVAGVSNTAGQDPAYLISILSDTYGEAVTNAPFYYVAVPTVINGVTIPAGTYIKSAYIAEASISSAKIKDLVANKITSGFINADIGMRTLSGYMTNMYAGGPFTEQRDSQGNVVGIIPASPTIKIEGGIADFKVDAFRVFGTGQSGFTPFYIDANGITRIDTALIEDATITRAKIGLATIDEARIEDGAISNAKIKNYISSTDFNGTISGGDITNNGTAGWALGKGGKAVIDAASIRGKLTANQIDTTGLVVYDSAGNPILNSGAGYTNNQVSNSDLLLNDSGWGLWKSDPNGNMSGGWAPNADWKPIGSGGGYIYENGSRPGNGIQDALFISDNIAVKGGSRIEASVYAKNIGCYSHLKVAFYDVNGNGIAEYEIASTGDNLKWPLSFLGSYDRIGGFIDAPANAASARIFVRKDGTASGAYSYAFFTRFYLGEAKTGQNELVSYAPSRVTNTRQLGYAGELDADRSTWNKAMANSGGPLWGSTYIQAASIDTLRVSGNAITVTSYLEGASSTQLWWYGGRAQIFSSDVSVSLPQGGQYSVLICRVGASVPAGQPTNISATFQVQINGGGWSTITEFDDSCDQGFTTSHVWTALYWHGSGAQTAQFRMGFGNLGAASSYSAAQSYSLTVLTTLR